MDKYLIRSKPTHSTGGTTKGGTGKAQQTRFGISKEVGEKLFKKPYSRPTSSSRNPRPSTTTSESIPTLGLPKAPTSASTGKKPSVPQTVFHSASVAQTRSKLIQTLQSPSNPITHNNGYERAQHIVSCATGHQVSNGRGGGGAEDGWMQHRLGKLKNQAQEAESDVLKGVCIWINGFTGNITNRQLVALVERAGGSTRPTLSYRNCTHIVTAMSLSGSKIERELKRNKGGCLIVTPEWVVKSVEGGKRLAEWRFPVIHNETQDRISTLFASTSGNNIEVQSTKPAVASAICAPTESNITAEGSKETRSIIEEDEEDKDARFWREVDE